VLVGDAFSPLRSALEGAGIRYAVGGSWASTAFGEPRFTNGVDIIADFTEGSLDRFLACLPKTFYPICGKFSTPFASAGLST
jgi:hypothetical protein